MKLLNLFVISLIIGVITTACNSEKKEYFITSELSTSLQKYDNIDQFNDGVFVVLKDNKYGFVDINGKEVVPCIYDCVYSFSEGLAKVQLHGKYGCIDTKGKEVIPCIYDYADSFSEGLAKVQLNGKWGYIDTKGEKVIPCIYDGADSFSEGLTMVQLNGKWGYIDTKGKEVIPYIYDYAESFSEGFAKVQQNGKCGCIDTKGKEVIPCIYDYAESFSEGLAMVQLNGKWGYIDTKGEKVIPCIYDGAGFFSEGLAMVQLNGKWGYIDTKGKEVIPCIYDYVYSFSEGLAIVQLNGKWGYIDTKGEEVAPCIYDYADSFSEGLAKVQLNSKYGYIDTKGEKVIPCKYDDADSFSEGLAKVQLNSKYGYIDTKGEEVVPYIYDYADSFSEGLAKVQLHGKCGYIDKKGNHTFSYKKKYGTQNDINSNKDAFAYQSEEINENVNDETETQEICDIHNLKESKYRDIENELLNGKVHSLEWSDGESNYVIKFNTNGDYQSIVHYSDNPHAPTQQHPAIPKYFIEGKLFNRYIHPLYNLRNISFGDFVYRGFAYIDCFNLISFFNVKESQYFYDNKSNISVIQTDRGKIEYNYSENGLLQGFLVNDLPMLQISWENNMMSEINIYKEDGSKFYQYAISYKDNSVILQNGLPFEKKIFHFDGNGRVTKIDEQINRDQNCKSLIYYDDKGRISNIRYLYNGRDNGEEIIQYDQYNNIVDIYVFSRNNSENKRMWDEQRYRFKYEYDDLRNWIQKDVYEVIVGDIEIEKKISTEIRKIKYYE